MHWAWYRDEVIEVIADEEPLIMALWPVMVAQGHEQSDEDRNPQGVLSTTIKKLSASSRVPRETVEALLEKLVEGEMIEVSTGRLGIIKIRCVNYRNWNHPRKSPARRQAEKRHADQFAGDLAPSVTEQSQEVSGVSQAVTDESLHYTTLPNTTLLTGKPAPELSRSVDLLFDAFPMVNRNALLMQLVEHSSMDSSPDPRFYLEAAIEIVGNKGSVRNSGGLFNLVVRKAQTKERNLGIDEAQAQKQAARFSPAEDKPVEIPSEVAARLSAWRASEEVAS